LSLDGLERRAGHGRYANAQLIELEAVRDVTRGFEIAGRNRDAWRDMIVKASMFAEGDDKQTAFPMRRVADRLVDFLDKRRAARDVVQRMHGIAAGKVARSFRIEAVGQSWAR
jgi:hypothetical protein